jgi:hypothetical protein
LPGDFPDESLGFKAEGDLLDDTFVADLTQQQIDEFFEKPLDYALQLLGRASTRIIYDLDVFNSTREQNPDAPEKWQPTFAATLARERHFSDPPPPDGHKIQVSLSYSDGFGREIQKKIQAEPGKVEVEDDVGNITTVDTSPNIRWVGSGWTIFNNKGKPVRQYEPFFSTNHWFQFGKIVGVSPVLFYDPVERVIAKLHPNHTYEKTVFDPWCQMAWDVNDTVLEAHPENDADVGDDFRRLPNDEYLPTWYTLRTDPAFADKRTKEWPDQKARDTETSAAAKAAKHTGTATVAHFDTLGRTFLAIADNGPEGKYATRVQFDIEGNQREVKDAKDRVVMRYDYDMLSNRIHQASMEAGERWTLSDGVGKPILAWDSRGHTIRNAYDELRRPTDVFLTETDGSTKLVERTEYGETQPTPELYNLRGKVYQLRDGAGIITNDDYDFKGNRVASRRELLDDYRATPDWSQNPGSLVRPFRAGTGTTH